VQLRKFLSVDKVELCPQAAKSIWLLLKSAGGSHHGPSPNRPQKSPCRSLFLEIILWERGGSRRKCMHPIKRSSCLARLCSIKQQLCVRYRAARSFNGLAEQIQHHWGHSSTLPFCSPELRVLGAKGVNVLAAWGLRSASRLLQHPQICTNRLSVIEAANPVSSTLCITCLMFQIVKYAR
jgi:hypothetical protein